MFQIALKKFLVLQKLKNTISDLKGEKIVEMFYEKELQKTNKKEFRAKKVIKRKGDKLYVKWKGHDNWFNNWTDKKDIV